MKGIYCFLLCLLLAACASPAPVAAPVEKPTSLFNDALFAAPSERISDDNIFAVDDEMRAFVDHNVTRKEFFVVMENSPNTKQHDLYAAKLEMMKSH